MNNNMDEDFTVTLDSKPTSQPPVPNLIRYSRLLFVKGLALGIAIAISIGGIFQYLIGRFDEDLIFRTLLHKLWFGVSIWTWLFSLIFFLGISWYIFRKIKN